MSLIAYEHILPQLTPITLDEMDSVKLMDRMDQKYLTNILKLPDVLTAAKNDYRILEIGSARQMGYESLYFDTPTHQMYLHHHNRKMNRYKVRIRQYLHSQEYFLEVKFKSNREQTRKVRIPVPDYTSLHSVEGSEFVRNASDYRPEELHPTLYTTFRRMTLVNPERFERVTIDTDIRFRMENHSVHLPFLVIMEVKNRRNADPGGFANILLDQRIFRRKLSKYCTATTYLYPEVKKNRFKAKLLYLKKLEKFHDHELHHTIV